jgi:hypothetical protein
MSDELTSLLPLAIQYGDDAILDELVHETAQEMSLGQLNELADPAEQEEHIAAIESQASDINNGGFERQIEYLLRAGVSAETIEAVLQGDG